jgi:hypothetical protein
MEHFPPPSRNNLETDPSELNNLADEHPELTQRLITALLEWNQSLPPDAGDPGFKTKTPAEGTTK